MAAPPATSPDAHGRRRVVIEGVSPEIDCGRFPIKRCVGDRVVVEADVFTDGHDLVAGCLRHRRRGRRDWHEVPLVPLGNDRWRAAFTVDALGRWTYTLVAWVAPFLTWRHDLKVRIDAGQDVSMDLASGARIVDAAAARATGRAAERLAERANALGDPSTSVEERSALALSDSLANLVARFPDRASATAYPRTLEIVVDRELACFGAWYEMFPRSASPEPGRHGTFHDVERRLPYIADMGFDVLYLPPIHPIGETNRKGRNNARRAHATDVGSPWAIGGAAGGHKAVHPELGTLEDFRRLVRAAAERDIEVALDLAFQASPDHPCAASHPEWFRHRPDGSIRHAENPPKTYEDIYPFDFESEEWRGLWLELKGIVDFWIGEGVRIFRVDNPHTKPFAFWEWLIDDVKSRHPETIFLSEAFTRPKVMYRLAKLGFTQSYTYFAWRNTKWELTEYLRELTRTEVREYFRPSFWTNTPDILTEYLQTGGRPAFLARLVLAATLVGSYGIYGPAFELVEARPREPGSEEYLDSEKYQLRDWPIDRADSLRDVIARVNRIRRENPAFRNDASPRFHPVDTEALIAYSRRTPMSMPSAEDDDDHDLILVVVNLDPFHTQAGWLELPLRDLGIEPDHPFSLHDLITGEHYLWTGARNYVELDPRAVPAHIFRVSRRARTERDFDAFM